MATEKRTYPNSYFAWYNDDDRLAIVERQTNTDDSKGVTQGEYDTYTDSTVTDGIKITIHSKYEAVTSLADDLQTTCGLNDLMHSHVLDYVKSRILEDQGDESKAQYFKLKYEADFNHKLIKFAAERSPEKWGKYTIGSVSYTHLTLPTNREV